MEENKNLEMNPEDVGLLIEQNVFLQHVLRIMNDLPLDSDKAEEINGGPIDYIQLWNNVSLEKKLEVGETPSPEAIAFYYQLLTTGYDNFGVSFFNHMGTTENISYLYYAIKCFMDYMTQDATEGQEKQA